MPTCAAIGCKQGKKTDSVALHRFPKNPQLRQQWISAVGRKDFVPSKTAVLCTRHFREEDVDRSSLCTIRLRENSVPSIFSAVPSYFPKTMGGCSVPGCSNRSERGVRLFAFPANNERRRKWTENFRSDDWTPSSGSRVCEMHFSEGQFEAHRQDGWRKLRPDAVPTIFNFSLISQSRCRPLKRRRSAPDVKFASKSLVCDESDATRFEAICHNSDLQSDLPMDLPPNNTVISLLQYSVEKTATEVHLDSAHPSPNEHSRLKVQVETLQAREKSYISKIRKLKHQLKTMDKILSNTEKNLEKILSLNQIHDIMFGSYDE